MNYAEEVFFSRWRGCRSCMASLPSFAFFSSPRLERNASELDRVAALLVITAGPISIVQAGRGHFSLLRSDSGSFYFMAGGSGKAGRIKGCVLALSCLIFFLCAQVVYREQVEAPAKWFFLWAYFHLSQCGILSLLARKVGVGEPCLDRLYF